MKHKTIGLWVRRLLMLAVGTLVSQAGIQMFVAIAIGSDPFMVFVQGVASVMRVSNGMAMNVILVILTVVLLITTRGYIRPGTVLCTFCVGPLVGMYERIYGALIPADAGLVLRIALILLASVIASLGLAIMLQSEAGACPNDLISVVLADKIKRLEFRYARIGTDAAMVVLGALLGIVAGHAVLGNVVGIGTVVSVLLYGPIIQKFTPLAQRMAKALAVNPNAEQ